MKFGAEAHSVHCKTSHLLLIELNINADFSIFILKTPNYPIKINKILKLKAPKYCSIEYVN